MLKKLVKKNLILTRLLKPIYLFVKWIPRKFGYYKAPKMLEGELDLFKAIYKQCRIIIDVGARFDVDYIKISHGNGIEYFLFEANPKFYKKLINNLKGLKENVHPEHFAIGEKNGLVDYYEDSESLLKNCNEFRGSTRKLKTPIKMIRLDDYLSNRKVEYIDFLKTDIEEYDYFALLGLGNYIGKCKFIQFEFGIGAPLGSRFVTYDDYYDLLEEFYDLYLVRDENNPLWIKGFSCADLIPIDEIAKNFLVHGLGTGVGFNVFCVNKSLGGDVGLLNISPLEMGICENNVFK
jgi:FkbM family methyltransferase